MPEANNTRVAKNTLFLYFRMILIMLVSLYTSRVVLAQLGISDFGIYNAWHTPTWLWEDFCPADEKFALEQATGVKVHAQEVVADDVLAELRKRLVEISHRLLVDLHSLHKARPSSSPIAKYVP